MTSHPNFDRAHAILDATRRGDLDAEHCEAFWQKNPATPSKDFS